MLKKVILCLFLICTLVPTALAGVMKGKLVKIDLSKQLVIFRELDSRGRVITERVLEIHPQVKLIGAESLETIPSKSDIAVTLSEDASTKLWKVSMIEVTPAAIAQGC